MHTITASASSKLPRLMRRLPCWASHTPVVQHSTRPGSLAPKTPAGGGGALEPPPGKVVAVNLPTDSVRLNCERPGLLHLYPCAPISDPIHRDLIARDCRFGRRDT